MQEQASTMFDDGFGTPTLPAGVFSKVLYFFYDRMPSRITGWEVYGGHLDIPEY